jgi:hypothetical protein
VSSVKQRTLEKIFDGVEQLGHDEEKTFFDDVGNVVDRLNPIGKEGLGYERVGGDGVGARVEDDHVDD